MPSPGRFRNAGNLPAQRQPPETQTANAEFAQVGTRASAQLAAVVLARRKLWFLVYVLNVLCSCRHNSFLTTPDLRPANISGFQCFRVSSRNLETCETLKPAFRPGTAYPGAAAGRAPGHPNQRWSQW